MRQFITPDNQALTVAGNAASTDAFNAFHYRDKTVAISGTFSGSVTVEGTVDGTTWAAVAGPVTAPAILSITQAVRMLRIVGSSWVSGTASAIFSGFNSRTD